MKRWFACALAAALLAAGCSNDGDSARLVGEETTTSSTLPEGVAFADDDPPVTTTTAAPVVPLTLRIGVPDLVFEPPYAVDEADSVAVLITDLLTDGLTTLDEDGLAVPALAESWSVSDDRLRWTFLLGSNDFSTGSPITATDVVASFDRLRGRGIESLTAPQVAAIDSVIAEDDSTVVVSLAEPFEELPQVLAAVPFGISPADETGGQQIPVSSALDLSLIHI